LYYFAPGVSYARSTPISQRVVFAESAASGNTVFEVDKNGSAAKEVKALVNELLKLGV
jgi:chromosome partitioning protein